MALTASFHGVDEMLKPPNKRLYHNNDGCSSALDIATPERQTGTGGYHLCKVCEKLDRKES
ncbi:MAG: hypothetical protein ACRD0Y_04675 [Terriglobales bacterium]